MTKNTKTNWSTPKTNIIAAANDLRKCLASGYKARLIRIMNEDCQFPILLDKNKLSHDFRNYEFSYGTVTTKAEIIANNSMSDFEKELSLNYKACYGSEESVKKYYTTGILSEDNFRGIGKSHLVKISDMIDFLNKSTDKKNIDYVKLWLYYIDETDDRHFYDYFKLKSVQERTAKIFKHKLYAVEMCGKDEEIVKEKIGIRILMVLIKIVISPLKYIPTKSTHQMPDYKWVTYRIGDVTNGYSIDIHIPKKFSFRK